MPRSGSFWNPVLQLRFVARGKHGVCSSFHVPGNSPYIMSFWSPPSDPWLTPMNKFYVSLLGCVRNITLRSFKTGFQKNNTVNKRNFYFSYYPAKRKEIHFFTFLKLYTYVTDSQYSTHTYLYRSVHRLVDMFSFDLVFFITSYYLHVLSTFTTFVYEGVL